ncbi:MAG TPA: 4Fe-4S dicluster domain-containing protein [Syntrophomonadaceae bacterium]|nr:4Fe-4S dicluster domain-containing protein [Syntrophomonadaceae bacterium]
MENRVFYIDYHKCVGCGTCEMVCSLVHEQACSPALSRIRVVRYRKEAYNVPVTCASCERPPCLDICPVGAIHKDRDSGEVSVWDEICIGCRQCSQACPFGHMNYNVQKGIAFKCDHCGGDPQCVKFCWTGAIEFLPQETAVEMKRNYFADQVLQEGTEHKSL